MSGKLRLLKVICQPVFVMDDGESLTEYVADPVVVAAADWPDWPSTGFAESFEQLQRDVERGGMSPADRAPPRSGPPDS